MTPEQKTLLKPHATHFSDMVAFVVTRDQNELRRLQEACAAASMTNCSWDTFAAAQVLIGYIRAEMMERRAKAGAQ